MLTLQSIQATMAFKRPQLWLAQLKSTWEFVNKTDQIPPVWLLQYTAALGAKLAASAWIIKRGHLAETAPFSYLCVVIDSKRLHRIAAEVTSHGSLYLQGCS